MAQNDDADEPFRRVNILIEEPQYREIQRRRLNLSGFIRDLITDSFSERHVVLSVSQRTRELYNEIISNFGATDEELESCLVRALDELLQMKAKDIETVRRRLLKKGGRER
jgi:hypothetical protein